MLTSSIPMAWPRVYKCRPEADCEGQHFAGGQRRRPRARPATGQQAAPGEADEIEAARGISEEAGDSLEQGHVDDDSSDAATEDSEEEAYEVEEHAGATLEEVQQEFQRSGPSDMIPPQMR